ncbi:hypothetical protein EDEG_00899 [Edhazardia aedis USNM 41457]|uniref:Uncharacterized protein n=1 Tax=Edhazardia aedis (strain USNM 41457) TaxID=1003232 RepID=J9DUK5_EDHAE|nr:hypothetical protein EDEG_00899 [Edhazardia aedis USNM 41457]|eukprot:EJW04982.1 hypothetical protein EDEG_00899 [Edhazardia aedis USNM 41457]
MKHNDYFDRHVYYMPTVIKHNSYKKQLVNKIFHFYTHMFSIRFDQLTSGRIYFKYFIENLLKAHSFVVIKIYTCLIKKRKISNRLCAILLPLSEVYIFIFLM